MGLFVCRGKLFARITVFLLVSIAPAFHADSFSLMSPAARVCVQRCRERRSDRPAIVPGSISAVANALEGPAAKPLPAPPSLLKNSARERRKALDGVIRACGLHPALVHSVIKAESGGNPKARSRRGAAGLMQLTPATARRLKVKNVYDPTQNVTAGSTYLRQLIVRYDNKLELALAAYNAGPRKVDSYGAIPPYPETRRYVKRIMRDYQAALMQSKME